MSHGCTAHPHSPTVQFTQLGVVKRAKSEGWGTGHISAVRQERKAERPRIFIHLRILH